MAVDNEKRRNVLVLNNEKKKKKTQNIEKKKCIRCKKNVIRESGDEKLKTKYDTYE